MKKNFENKTRIEIENNSDDIISNQQAKTTNVNILLNRVRLDQKKNLQKKLIFSFITVSIISVLIAFQIL